MPTRECNFVDKETGFKCMKPFQIPSNTYRRYKCDKHEHHSNRSRNVRVTSAKLREQKDELRNYVQDLKDDVIPAIQVKLLEGMHEREELLKKINEMPKNKSEEKTEEFKDQLEIILEQFNVRKDAYKSRAKDTHARILDDFRQVKNEIDANLISQLDAFSLESEVTKRFANQINMLNNRNVAYEKRIAELEDKIKKLG